MVNVVRQFGKNIFTSWAALAIRILLVFLVNPFIIHTLGNDLYGVWVLVISIVNYMTILDLGLKQALIRFISKYLGLREYDRINALLNTSFLIYSIAGIFVIGLTLALSFFALDWFNIPDELLSQGRIALIIIGVNTALSFALFSWGDSLGAFHRFDVINGLMIFEDLFRTATIVIMLKNGYGLIPFALAYLSFNIIRLLIGSGFLRKLHPKIRLSLRTINRETLRMLFGYGIISFFISVAWLFIVNTDHVLIGYFLDTASVTKYAIAAGFIVYLRSLIQAASFPLRPIISHYDALDKKENVVYIYTHGTKYLYFFTFVVAGGTIFFADSLISLWMGQGYQETASVLKILILPAAIFLPQSIASSVMFGLEKHRYLLYVLAAEAILNIFLSIILVSRFGLYGIAYGTIIPQLLIYLFIIPRIIKSILAINLADFYKSLAGSAVSAFALSAVLSYFLKSLLIPSNWVIFFGEAVLVAAVCLSVGYKILGREELKTLIDRLRDRS